MRKVDLRLRIAAGSAKLDVAYDADDFCMGMPAVL